MRIFINSFKEIIQLHSSSFWLGLDEIKHHPSRKDVSTNISSTSVQVWRANSVGSRTLAWAASC